MLDHTFRLVVLDMAGTTVDEDNTVYRTLQLALARAGVQLSLDSVLQHGAGKEKLVATRDLLTVAGRTDLDATEVHADFRELLERAYATLEVRPFAGVHDFMFGLRRRGCRVALNTGYDGATARQLLSKLDWRTGRDFDMLVTADDVAHGRPAPDMILLAMRRLGIDDPATVAKVGDSVVDIQEGRNAGCGLVVGVTTGAQTREQLLAAGPDVVVGGVGEL